MKAVKLISVFLVIFSVLFSSLFLDVYAGGPVIVDENHNGIDDSQESDAEYKSSLAKIIAGFVKWHLVAGVGGGTVASIFSESIKDAAHALSYYSQNGEWPDEAKEIVEQSDIEISAADAQKAIGSIKDSYGFTQDNLTALDNGTYTFDASYITDFSDYYPPVVGYVGGDVDWDYILENCVVGTQTINPVSSLFEMVYYSDFYKRNPHFVGPYQYTTVDCSNGANFTFALNKESNGYFNYWYRIYNNSSYSVFYGRGYNTIACTASDVYTVYICAPVSRVYLKDGDILRGLYYPVVIYNETKQAYHTRALASSYLRNDQSINYSEELGIYSFSGAVGYFHNYHEGAAFYECFGSINPDDYVVQGDNMVKNADGTYTNITQNITYNPELDYSQIYDAIKNGLEDASLTLPRDARLDELVEKFLDMKIATPEQSIPDGLTEQAVRDILDDYLRQISVDTPADTTNDNAGFFDSVTDWLRKIRDSLVTAKDYVVYIYNFIVSLPTTISTAISDGLSSIMYYFNPNHPDFNEPFGEWFNSIWEPKFDGIEDFMQNFYSITDDERSLLIEHDIYIGGSLYHLKVDLSFYEQYRLLIRSGIAVVFYLLFILVEIKIIFGMFDIQVGGNGKTSISSEIDYKSGGRK